MRDPSMVQINCRIPDRIQNPLKAVAKKASISINKLVAFYIEDNLVRNGTMREDQRVTGLTPEAMEGIRRITAEIKQDFKDIRETVVILGNDTGQSEAERLKEHLAKIAYHTAEANKLASAIAGRSGVRIVEKQIISKED